MKVSDVGLLTNDGEGFADRLSVALQAHIFEKQILEYCRGNNMDRVVVAVDYGDCPVEVNGEYDAIFYLIFELADGDVRVQLDKSKRFNLIWSLGALHHLAVAIQQLHSAEVSHNDIKPPNLLVFAKVLQKLADLGRATSPLFRGIYDEEFRLGDPRYAAPEILYAQGQKAEVALCNQTSRRASDIYQLGSMAYFFVTGTMFTPAIISRLSPEHRPRRASRGWTGDFQGVILYWREAHARAMEDFANQLQDAPAPIQAGMTNAVAQLCEVDPSLRGHPANRKGSHDALSVARYVTEFDLLRRRAIALN